MPRQVRAEGKTELVGDIVLDCRSQNGTPASSVANLQVTLNREVTNEVYNDTILRGVTLTVAQGDGSNSATLSGRKAGSNSLAFNGVALNASSGRIVLRVSGIRAAVFPSLQPVSAFVTTSGSGGLLMSQTSFQVGQVETGLYTSGTSLPIQCGYSVLPGTTFREAVESGTVGFSARATEGFASSFTQRDARADWGTRLIVRYTGFPASARLAVPDVIAGSSSNQPTALGDFGGRASAGSYTAGSLLLVRILGTDANGAGGYAITNRNSESLPFGMLRDVPLTSGAGFAVYEVVDDNPNFRENAQIPTFIDWRAPANSVATVGMVTIGLAAQGEAGTPRFSSEAARPDCTAVGDCNSGRFPQLYMDTTPIAVTARQGGAAEVRYLPVRNEAGGYMQWNVRVVYQEGSDWIRLEESSGINNATVRADLLPSKVPGPGTYRANLVVEAGQAGSRSVPITLTIQASGPVLQPAITANGVRNEDGGQNSEALPAYIESAMRFLVSGIPESFVSSVRVRLHDWEGLVPLRTGLVEGQADVRYLDVVIPKGMPGIRSEAQVCVLASPAPVCTKPVAIHMKEAAVTVENP